MRRAVAGTVSSRGCEVSKRQREEEKDVAEEEEGKTCTVCRADARRYNVVVVVVVWEERRGREA